VTVVDPSTPRSQPCKRFPRFVYRHGDEPDPRFSLANERTFLAWIRTALALALAALALDVLTSALEAPARRPASIGLVGLSAVIAIGAWFRWARAERALRLGEPLPGPLLTVAVIAGLLVVLGLLAVGFGRQ
jgi:putative membrane protein